MTTEQNIFQWAFETRKALGGSIIKGSTAKAGKFSYDYVDLPQLWDALAEYLDAGRVLIHSYGKEGYWEVELRQVDRAGMSNSVMCSSWPVEADPDFQTSGKLMTYHTRYQTLFMLGIIGVKDDDGAGHKRKEAAPAAEGGRPGRRPRRGVV